MLGISQIELAERIESLNVGDEFELCTYMIRLKKISDSDGQLLYHLCLYDKFGKLIRNDPVFLSHPKRQKRL